MARVTFENGVVVNFQGTPTQKDIEEVAAKLNIQKKPSYLKDTLTDIKAIGGDITERIKRSREAQAMAQRGEQAQGSANLQTVGQIAGAIGDIGYRGIKAVAPEFVEQGVKKGLSALVNTQLAQKGLQSYGEFKQQSPEKAANVEAGLNIATLAPIGLLSKVAATTGTKMAARGAEAIPGVGRELVEAGKDIAQSGLSRAGTKAQENLAGNLNETFREGTIGVSRITDYADSRGINLGRELVDRNITPIVDNDRLKFSPESFRLLDNEISQDSRLLDDVIAQYKDTKISVSDLKLGVARLIASSPELVRQGAVESITEKALKQIDNYALQSKSKFFTLPQIQSFKKGMWEASKKFKATETGKSDAFSELGRYFMHVIEDEVTDVRVKNINAKIGRAQEVYKLLEKVGNLQGGGIVLKGGRVGRYATDLIGVGAGAVLASPFGPVASAIGGYAGHKISNTLRTLSQKAGVLGPVDRLLIKFAEKIPEDSTIKQAKQFLEDVKNGKKPTMSPRVQKAFQEILDSAEVAAAFKDEITHEMGVYKLGTNKTTGRVEIKNYSPSNSSAASKKSQTNIKSIPKVIKPSIQETPKKVNTSNKKKGLFSNTALNRGFIATGYKETGDLTTKLLKDLEGKTTVSKQYILDATNRPELKQVEKDLIRSLVEKEGDKVNVADFANKVKAELLPLRVVKNKDLYTGNDYGAKYENITLPSELRGEVKDYKENVYESPIETSAGRVHFSEQGKKGYFGHTRIEDMADNKTRRVIEVQSDLYQKGNLEKELVYPKSEQTRAEVLRGLSGEDKIRYEELSKKNFDVGLSQPEKDEMDVLGNKSLDKLTEIRKEEAGKLTQYNDPTAHFRMIREEIKKAAQDGKTKLQFPTGETAMKIEGLGDNIQFYDVNRMNETRANGMASDLHRQGEALSYATLKPTELKIGQEVSQGAGNQWIITDVLGDGKFKAVQKSFVDIQPSNWKITLETESGKVMSESSTEKGLVWVARNEKNGKMEFQPFAPSKKQDALTFLKEKIGSKDKSIKELGEAYGETFDISGKVDTSNPIYKFYEKDVQKYLNKFGGKRVVDDKGVSWIEIPITKKQGEEAVEAFGKVTISPLFAGASASVITAALADKRVREKIKNVLRSLRNSGIEEQSKAVGDIIRSSKK